MFREFLLFLGCLNIIGFCRCYHESPTIPICENKSSTEVYLDLSKMGIGPIGKAFVSSDAVACLNLAGNQISQMAKNAFDEVPHLRYLNLAHNPIEMTDLAKVNLAELKVLVLDDLFDSDDIARIDNFNSYSEYNSVIDIYRLPELEKLSISLWKMDNDPLMWIYHFDAPNLRELYLIDSNIGSLHFSEKILANLTDLYLDNNQVKSFVLGNSLPNLERLSINRNGLRTIGGKNFTDRENFISPHGLHALEYLSLQGNGINEVESDAFEDLINLRSLNLAENLIPQLAETVFEGLGNLKNLTLDQNELKEVPSICSLKNLEILSLNRNNIKTIRANNLCDLPNLRVLRLSGNGFTDMVDDTFKNLPKLLRLDLSWNTIRSLPQNWTTSANHLEELRLDGNKFEDIDSMSLDRFTGGLSTLSIGHNTNMKKITVLSLTKLPPLTTIEVSRDCWDVNDHPIV